ncbi:MAG: hypothetical protein ACXVC6_11420 [Bacteroidia bacterium]
MEWINVKDQRPKNNQTVLASINGIYKITRFNEQENALIEISSNQFFLIDNSNLSIYWTIIETPVK